MLQTPTQVSGCKPAAKLSLTRQELTNIPMTQTIPAKPKPSPSHTHLALVVFPVPAIGLVVS